MEKALAPSNSASKAWHRPLPHDRNTVVSSQIKAVQGNPSSIHFNTMNMTKNKATNVRHHRFNECSTKILLLLPLRSYDECVGPGCTHIYIPTDDPPPYSLWDPHQNNSEGAEEGPSSAGAASPPPEHRRVASISFPSEAAPPYEAVVGGQGRPLPLVPCDLSKYQSERNADANRRQSGISQIS